ncbi:hypothetical protein J4423_00070 [Candidatus Pacearchaeota archaeon]|nr:hypothetical protein [Candidatus Pacearchaeota archaeon]
MDKLKAIVLAILFTFILHLIFYFLTLYYPLSGISSVAEFYYWTAIPGVILFALFSFLINIGGDISLFFPYLISYFCWFILSWVMLETSIWSKNKAFSRAFSFMMFIFSLLGTLISYILLTGDSEGYSKFSSFIFFPILAFFISIYLFYEKMNNLKNN